MLNEAVQGIFEAKTDGVYSIEVARRNRDPDARVKLGEFFFLTGPQTTSNSTSNAVSVRKTYRGASISDQGRHFDKFSMEGEIHVPHRGYPRDASGNFTTLGERLIADLDLLDKSGRMDLNELLWVLMWSRDPKTFHAFAPPELLGASGTNLAATRNLYVNASGDEEFNYQDHMFVLHDYQLLRKLEVVVEKDGGPRIGQNALDPFTYTWSVEFTVVADLSDRTAAEPVRVLPNIQTAIPNLVLKLDETLMAVSDTLSRAADIIAVADQVRGLKTELARSLDGFSAASEASIRNVRSSLGLTREKNSKLRDLIKQFYLAGRTEDSFLTDDYTEYGTDSLEADAAALAQTINQINAQLIDSQNGILAEPSRFVPLPPGVETWTDLSRYLYGDTERIDELMELNSATGPPTEYLKVRVPSDIDEHGRSGVIEELRLIKGDPDLHGADIAFINGDIAISGNGDIGMMRGLETLINASLDRLEHVPGTVPMHPGWGAASIPGTVPGEFVGTVEASRAAANLLLDRGVRAAEIEKAEIDGTAIKSTIAITARTGQDFRLQYTTFR